MSTSLSSSALSSSTTTHKQNIRRIGGTPPSKQKPKPEPVPSVETPVDTQISTKDNNEEEENLPVNEDTQEKEPTAVEDVQPSTPSPPPAVEPINIDTVTEIINSTEAVAAAVVPISKREQQIIDQQEYQRKLNQKIREAQQRLEAERQREEERQRQLELEEYEHEQEQIRLVEEQRRVEQERLQRAIEERERENELKRQEEQRLQQQREELERKQAEETERLARERQERAKKEEEERNERKKRLELVKRRTRQASPSSKVTSSKFYFTSIHSIVFSRKRTIIKRISMIQTDMIKNNRLYLIPFLIIVFQLQYQPIIS
jgi:MAP7 domain-containing protein 1